MFAYCGNAPVSSKDSTGTVYVVLEEYLTDVDPDNQHDEGGAGGGGWGLGVNPSYYTAQRVEIYNWDWQNSSYNQNPTWSNELCNQEAINVDAFEALLNDPTSVVGKTESDVASALGEDWTNGKYGTSKQGWKFNNGDKMVAYHPGNGRHKGSYYVLTSSKTGRIKIVGPDYIESPDDKATIIRYP